MLGHHCHFSHRASPPDIHYTWARFPSQVEQAEQDCILAPAWDDCQDTEDLELCAKAIELKHTPSELDSASARGDLCLAAMDLWAADSARCCSFSLSLKYNISKCNTSR